MQNYTFCSSQAIPIANIGAFKSQCKKADKSREALIGLLRESSFPSGFHFTRYIDGYSRLTLSPTRTKPFDKRKSNKGRKKGRKWFKTGLDAKSKRKIRLVGYGFQRDFGGSYMITLTTNNKVKPLDSEFGPILKKFFQRLGYAIKTEAISIMMDRTGFNRICKHCGKSLEGERRNKKYCDKECKRGYENDLKLKYAWVAETQESGNLHYHIIMPGIVEKVPGYNFFNGLPFMKKAVNRIWNECMIDFAKNERILSKNQLKRWKAQAEEDQNYLDAWQDWHDSGKFYHKPSRKGQRDLLLLPNVKYEKDQSGYLSKYISKDKNSRAIEAAIYSISSTARAYTLPENKIKEIVPDFLEAGHMLNAMSLELTQSKVDNSLLEFDKHRVKILICKDGEKLERLIETYFGINKIKAVRKKIVIDKYGDFSNQGGSYKFDKKKYDEWVNRNNIRLWRERKLKVFEERSVVEQEEKEWFQFINTN